MRRRIRHDAPVRIGTWNLDGRWSDEHRSLMLEADCDVWLLTEVNERTTLPGYVVHATQSRMAPRRRWAGVASRLPMASTPDPHPASAQVQIGATTYVSSVLPWRACGARAPWVGDRHAEKTANTTDDLLLSLRPATSLVWGGDWNHALTGKEYAGSQGGRRAIQSALDDLGLAVPTAELPHRIDGLLTIDHIAVPRGGPTAAIRVVAEHDGKRLSDHDAYICDLRPQVHSTAAGDGTEIVVPQNDSVKREIEVVGAVIVRDGLVFCVQRGLGGSLPGLWEFPGGKIERGEVAAVALEREIDEELRCRVKVGSPVTTTAYEYEFGTVRLTTFYCELADGDPELTEHAALRWLAPEDLDELDWAPADVPAVAKIQSDLG